MALLSGRKAKKFDLFNITHLVIFSYIFYKKLYYKKVTSSRSKWKKLSFYTYSSWWRGIVLSLTWFTGLVYLNFTEQIESNLFYALLVGVLISIVSFFDDLYELSPKLKLGVQALVAMLELFFLGVFSTITLGLFDISFLLSPIFLLSLW